MLLSSQCILGKVGTLWGVKFLFKLGFSSLCNLFLFFGYLDVLELDGLGFWIFYLCENGKHLICSSIICLTSWTLTFLELVVGFGSRVNVLMCCLSSFVFF